MNQRTWEQPVGLEERLNELVHLNHSAPSTFQHDEKFSTNGSYYKDYYLNTT